MSYDDNCVFAVDHVVILSLCCRELLPNVLDMVSVLISVVSNGGDSSSGQSTEESRKATATLFKKLKVQIDITEFTPSLGSPCKETC